LTPGGVGNLADNVSMTTGDALDTATEFLGDSYSEVSPGVFQSSADGNGIFNPGSHDRERPRWRHARPAPQLRAMATRRAGRNRLFNYHVWLPEE
jgi:hypothetical protein